MELRAGKGACCLLRASAPENAGDVVRAAVRPGDGQHHVADLPAKGRSAIDGRLADRAREAHVILRGLVGRRERIGVDRDDEPTALRRAVIERTDLPGDGDAFAAEEVGLVQNVLRREHGQKIDRARESFDAERQPVKVPVVVGVRVFRQSIQRAGERNAVGCVFHSSTSFSSYGKLYEVGRLLMPGTRKSGVPFDGCFARASVWRFSGICGGFWRLGLFHGRGLFGRICLLGRV